MLLSHGDGELPSIALGTRLQAPREPTDTEHPHTHSRGRAAGCRHQHLPGGCWLCQSAAELLEHSPVEEYAADIVVRDGRLLGAGCHPQRPQEVVDEDVELLDVLSLCLQHAEDDLVPLAHAVGVGGPDVVLDDRLPLPPAQPAPQEALHLPREQQPC